MLCVTSLRFFLRHAIQQEPSTVHCTYMAEGLADASDFKLNLIIRIIAFYEFCCVAIYSRWFLYARQKNAEDFASTLTF